MLPQDAAPPTGEARDFLVEHYKVPEEDVDALAEKYGVLYTPSDRRLLFPYYYSPDQRRYPLMLAVWAPKTTRLRSVR